MQNADAEIGKLAANIEQLVDRLQLLQEENRALKQKVATLTKQLAKLYSELNEAKRTIEELRAAQPDEAEAKDDPFAPMVIPYEEKLLIRHQLERLLEQVNLELQRLS
ncbi:MAG: hypothetical protein NZM06_11485 [Chloroherpetonaceae bacterium]|nr:hypothetical protein [Chloroherpetonaceae bacterium]MDW8438297.1 hypothetical protein [Chloroherpetonaceae bacterium]